MDLQMRTKQTEAYILDEIFFFHTLLILSYYIFTKVSAHIESAKDEDTLLEWPEEADARRL